MQQTALRRLLEDQPVVAAVKQAAAAKTAAESPVHVAFVLGGDILSLPQSIALLRDAGKQVFVHLDLVEGIGKDAAGVRYAAHTWHIQGIISTRSNLLRHGQDEGLITVQRMFLLDAASMESGISLVEQAHPDFVEIMPGVIPKAIAFLKNIRQPVIAGGMITEKQEIVTALQAGALAVSTSNPSLWLA